MDESIAQQAIRRKLVDHRLRGVGRRISGMHQVKSVSVTAVMKESIRKTKLSGESRCATGVSYTPGRARADGVQLRERGFSIDLLKI